MLVVGQKEAEKNCIFINLFSYELKTRSKRVKGEWNYNSLNLLFTEPGNITDIERIVTNSGNEDKASDYFWAAHNIIKASEESDGEGLDCIWSAYCTELDNRASLGGKEIVFFLCFSYTAIK